MDLSRILVTLGIVLIAGFFADALGRRTALPRVTLLIAFGLLIGPSALNLLPPSGDNWFALASHVALAMVGFLLGESLSFRKLRKNGRAVFSISASVVIVGGAIVSSGLVFAGFPLAIALVLGGVAAATDPVATVDVVRSSNAKGPFTSTLLGVVAIDDAWGLIVFSLLLTAAQALSGGIWGLEMLAHAAWEVCGAALLGCALGLPMAMLTGRVRAGEPTQAEALGFVFLCSGIALWLEFSFLLAAMTMGAVVANLARHHSRPFHAIEGIGWPFVVLFFVLAGASLHLESLAEFGALAAAYVLLRVTGRALGAAVGANLARGSVAMRRFMGLAMLPQAGVALGMALVATARMPEHREAILAVVISTTIAFELIGPVFTRLALQWAGEAGAGDGDTSFDSTKQDATDD
ncbi:MAG: cation:proton antiporter [bacterium]|nr:cation:proton antiporter [bacterium]